MLLECIVRRIGVSDYSCRYIELFLYEVFVYLAPAAPVLAGQP